VPLTCRPGEDRDNDGIIDADETSPIDPDTDDGCVDDGTEVGQGTDPLDPTDDDCFEPPAPDGGIVEAPDAGPPVVAPGDSGAPDPVEPEPGFVAGSAVYTACSATDVSTAMPWLSLGLLLLLGATLRRRD
jgi:MYXO-CTERM domain-containing protein